MTILDRRYLRVDVSKTLPKHTIKKQIKKQILKKQAVEKPNTDRVAVVATSTCRPTFLTPTLENTIRLQQSKRLKNQEYISYCEKVGDF